MTETADNPPFRNIYLIGYRCTGKSSVGRALAGLLDFTFIDADVFLEEEAGRPISKIVEADGWPAFRAQEEDCLKRISRSANQVVATGGGVILDPDNVRRMQGTGVVVWLVAAPEIISLRMAKDAKTDSQRPSLTGKDVIDEIESVMSSREPLYANAADFHVVTDQNSVAEVCQVILKRLAGWKPPEQED